MTPDELSKRLRAFADKLDRSDRPSSSLVQSELAQIAADLRTEVYESGLSAQESESAKLPGSRRPAAVSLDVSKDSDYLSTMNGLQRRASRR